MSWSIRPDIRKLFRHGGIGLPRRPVILFPRFHLFTIQRYERAPWTSQEHTFLLYPVQSIQRNTLNKLTVFVAQESEMSFVNLDNTDGK